MPAMTVFIGSGEASYIERKVLIYSILKNSRFRIKDIQVFNGTHDCIEDACGNVIAALQTPLPVKKEFVTEFSLYRFMIPMLMGYKGRAIWLDSDIVCLSDISLIEKELKEKEFDIACVSNAYPHIRENIPATSVMYMNCNGKGIFDWESICHEIASDKKYSASALATLSEDYTDLHPLKILPLHKSWNSFDELDADTKLIHFTDLRRQPWRYSMHRFGGTWFRYFREALNEGFITLDDVELAISRGNVRQSVTYGNFSLFQDLKFLLSRLRTWI